MMTDDKILVGMADYKVAKGNGVLKTSGLGSCVGVILYDPASRIAGMAHVMLPSSEIARTDEFNPAKYADTALPAMLAEMARLGARQLRMEAKMAGGAQMFAAQSLQDTMRIGPRNVESCKAMLEKLGIPLVAEDTGGNYGRTIEFNVESGRLLVRSVLHGIKEL